MIQFVNVKLLHEKNIFFILIWYCELCIIYQIMS